MSSTLSISIESDDTDANHPYISPMTQTHLPHRAVIEIVGPDAPVFLERVLTNEIATQPAGETRYNALLTPQGKVIVDFLICRVEDDAPHFFLDIPASESEALKKRLTMFRLRSDATITLRDDLAVWHGSDKSEPGDGTACIMHDPRDETAGFRILRTRNTEADDTDLTEWHMARTRIGLPEFGFDFGASEVFPTDINMDVLGGIDYKKGCFIGQEVVSRMKRRGKIRKRTIIAEGSEPISVSSSLHRGSSGVIGTVSSQAGTIALARIRTDRLAAAETAGEIISIDERHVTIKKPDWLQGEMAALVSDD